LTEFASFVLPVDKPAGPTSHDVVAIARRALGTKRVGHTGTLDPFASGLLLLCVGGATRIAEYLSDLPKTYRATARFDGRTLTDDGTSEVMEPTDAWQAVAADPIETAFQAQVGDIMQLPPQYSAKKIAGERAYDIARRGDVAALVPVPVHIAAIRLLRVKMPDVEFEVDCASGTYIRAIARDVGALLGTGGYLTQLRRTSVGRFHADQAVALADIGDRARVAAAAIPPAQALAHMPALELTAEQERAIRFGQTVTVEPPAQGPVVLTRDGELIAIADADGSQIRPRKVMANV
jgi:tRNA pseudouridine55 synthase